MKSTEIVKYTSGSFKNKKLINSLVLVIFKKKNENAETMIFFWLYQIFSQTNRSPSDETRMSQIYTYESLTQHKNMQIYNLQEELIKSIKTKSGNR